MNSQYKDYYKILGVDRTSSQEEVRKTYRKLARKFHPDINPGNKQAEERFKEINEAYEVISNPEKRKRYDELGTGWQHGQSFKAPPGFERHYSQQGFPNREEFHFGGTGFSEFFESMFGGASFRNHPGTGFENKGQDIEGDLTVTIEEAYHGVTRSISVQHNGKDETYHVKIPPGLRSGAKLRLAGRGKEGLRGGARGNLYLTIHHVPHPFLHFEENDLVYDLDVSPWEAVLGTTLTFSTLSQKVKLKITPGTQNGTRLKLKGQGYKFSGKEAGDLIVETHVEVPKEISDEERKSWEELARKSRFNPRE
jgi:curved DNA-binding protein